MGHKKTKTRRRCRNNRKSRKYKKQRGGNDQQPSPNTLPNVTEQIDNSLNLANSKIKEVKQETENTILSWFGSLFGSQPTTGGRRRKKRKYLF